MVQLEHLIPACLGRHAGESGHLGAAVTELVALDPRLRGGDEAERDGNHLSDQHH